LAIFLFLGVERIFPGHGIVTGARIAGIVIIPALYLLYVKMLWRLPLGRLGGMLCDMPDLNGRWEGTIDRKDSRGPHPHVIEIRQTLTSLHVRNFGDGSESRAGASIYHYGEDKLDCILVYAFEGQSKRKLDGKERKKGIVTYKGQTKLSLVKAFTSQPPDVRVPFKRFFIFPPSCYDLIGGYSSDRTDTDVKVTGEIKVIWKKHELKGGY
jgi:hypothetical protein